MQRLLAGCGRRLLSTALSGGCATVPRCLHGPVASPVMSPSIKPLSHHSQLLGLGFRPISPLLPHVVQVRHFAAKDRSRAPRTPVTSKLKKYKLKSYSSFKFRFMTLNDGTIRRWRSGKRHNAHSKSKEAKRRLRRPAIVHAAYAKVMKKLNFCG